MSLWGMVRLSANRRVAALNRVETSLPGVFLIESNVCQDSRGLFLESYHEAKFAELGITDHFVQDNHSCSGRGVLRGLHYQLRHPQTKLIRGIQLNPLPAPLPTHSPSPPFPQSYLPHL